MTLLTELGFKYDNEDNLWYDSKFDYRIGVSDNNKYLEVFKGGYTNKIGKYSIEEFEQNHNNILK